MHAFRKMTFAKKERCRPQIQLERHSRNGKKRGDVIIAGGSQPHDFRIDELFTRKPGLSQKPPHPRVKPEHRGGNFFNNR
jgi:hypothetical protein